MLTSFGKTLNPEHPLPEHPTPQFMREKWLNLNGKWDYAICEKSADETIPTRWDGQIVVPFSPEAPLSGVDRRLDSSHTLWYRLPFSLDGWLKAGETALLHFGAVDQEAAVYVNGHEAGKHMGGYTSFFMDITSFLVDGENQLVVRVHDDTDESWHSRGKQSSKRGGIWYTPQSGIWQTVWLEAVPDRHIASFCLIPNIDNETLSITVCTKEAGECVLTLDGTKYPFSSNVPFIVSVPELHFWSPENPRLYHFTLDYDKDRVSSYFAMRKTEVKEDENGIKRLFLNNKPYFHNGLLDQGYWPDGLYTPPSDEAMANDIQTMKDLGFNMLRKHIKVEPMRWYYHCDRLGMLVWQDMINGGGKYSFRIISVPLITGMYAKDSHYRAFAREHEEGRREYFHELHEMICQLRNTPSIVLWVPFNEGWGQFDAAEACRRIRELDDSRPIDHASGWHDQKIGDIRSLHVYFRPYRYRKDKLGRAVVLSEFGGYHLPVKGHCWNDARFGYKGFQTKEELWHAYEKLFREQILPAIPKGLAASVYTQVTDVEDEVNGLLTYDRKVLKVPREEIRKLNALLTIHNEGK